MAKSSPSKAIPYFLRVRPANHQTKFNLTRAYLQAGRPAEGLRVAKEISAKPIRQRIICSCISHWEYCWPREKQYRAGQLELERANALQPETYEILYNLGQAYVRGTDYKKAEPVLQRALKLKPDSPETLYWIAQVYSNQGKAATALDYLVRARKLAPKNTDVIFLLARPGMSQSYFEDAIPLLETGIKIAPQRADLHAALGESYSLREKREKRSRNFKHCRFDPSAQSYASWAGLPAPGTI